jgi:hypothetical protein
MESKQCVLSLSCRSDGSTELAEVFAKSKGGSQFGRWPNASRVSTHKWTTWPNRQEACKTVVFGGGGLNLASFSYRIQCNIMCVMFQSR